MHSLQDVTQRETVVGATGPGSRTLTYPKALNELLGTKFKIVSGYPGGNEITLALERGEVEGYCGWALGSIKTRAPDWIRDGKIRPLAQFTLAKTADLPNVPLATDLARTDRERRAIEFFAADSVLAWPLVAPPDMPAERLGELRAAFDAMMQDPQLLAEAASQGLDIDPVSGAEIAELVQPPLWHAAGRPRSRAQDQRFALAGMACSRCRRLPPTLTPAVRTPSAHITDRQTAVAWDGARAGPGRGRTGAIITGDVRRFGHVINTDGVFGTHRCTSSEPGRPGVDGCP